MLLSNHELSQYGLPAGESDLADASYALLKQQHATWPMLQKGASTLGSVIVREIEFDGFSMKLQFNPGRIVSSAAKVDAKTIAERKCFLCLNHLPNEQKGIVARGESFGTDEAISGLSHTSSDQMRGESHGADETVSNASNYVILVNPFPIFSEHFTIPHRLHVPQRILGSIPAMLDITSQVGSRYSLFYNGPRCGASAPDHLHFQAGDFGFMTIDHSWPSLVEQHGQWVRESDQIRVAKVDDGLRRFFVIESDDKTQALVEFTRIYHAFENLNPLLHPGVNDLEEPMVNVLTSYRDGTWRIIVFLRKKHRPNQFFLEGDDQILFSPASVDFGGVCITPVQKDFESITRDNLTDMFNQLSIPAELFKKLS